MPSYRITETATGNHLVVREPTDWDAWMHYKFTRRTMDGGGPMPFDGRMRVTGNRGRHDYAVEMIDPDTGIIIEGTYLTAFRVVPDAGHSS
jgi:hypothetical protein